MRTVMKVIIENARLLHAHSAHYSITISYIIYGPAAVQGGEGGARSVEAHWSPQCGP